MFGSLLALANPYLAWIKGAAIALALAAIFAAGWKVKGWRDDAAQVSAVEAAVAQRAADDKLNYDAALAAARQVEKVRYVTKTVTKQVTLWRDRPAAHVACLDADGLRLANAALGGATPAGPQPSPAVPRPCRRSRKRRSRRVAVKAGGG